MTKSAERRVRDRRARALNHALIEAEQELEDIVERVIAVDAYADPVAEASRLAERLTTLGAALRERARTLVALAGL